MTRRYEGLTIIIVLLLAASMDAIADLITGVPV